ncbi:MAG: putative baseplate assembly protein [Chloroflexota bacterium]|nr:putative baseplate assembly protein [Chloroflexota bacterium]
MALPAPSLDDRKFQDIVEEARSLIPRYCPEWTDHNLSDPGITLIELFAWMVDLLLYRLNKVPDKNYIRFLDLIGVTLLPPAPARVDITFRLSAPQPGPVTIPRGTEVATVRTETEEAISFATEDDLVIQAPTLAHVLLTRDNSVFVEYTSELAAGTPLDVFKQVPEAGNSFYLGYSEPLAGNVLVLTMGCDDKRGVGIDPNDPPLVWEYWDGALAAWCPLERRADAVAWLERDGTLALNRRGDVTLHLPQSFAATEVDLRRAYWLRCRVDEPRPGQPTYEASPRILSISSSVMGGTVAASHAGTMVGEVLGRSDGTAGQVFRLANTPVLPRRQGETVMVETEDGGYEGWREVADFSESGPEDRHFVLDSAPGEVTFGPAVRQPNGETRWFGMVPPKGRQMRFSSYRYGGGSEGNVGKGTITVLKSSIAYVAAVTNRRAASGGVDAETVEHAKLRGPRTLRTRNRAVTEEDFEFLALEASPSVARARCLQPREALDADQPPPGVVHLALVPAFSLTDGMAPPDQLELPRELKEQVRAYLNERRLLTTALTIGDADYRWVSVQANVRVKPRFDPQQVRHAVERRLYQFINPLFGGPEGGGWPFGRDLFLPEVHSCIQGVEGVDFAEDVRLYPVNVATGERGEATERVKLSPAGLVCSYRHEITS